MVLCIHVNKGDTSVIFLAYEGGTTVLCVQEVAVWYLCVIRLVNGGPVLQNSSGILPLISSLKYKMGTGWAVGGILFFIIMSSIVTCFCYTKIVPL